MTKKAKDNNHVGSDKTHTVVSFKLSNDYYKKLVEYSEPLRDEDGFKLSPSTAARKIIKGVLDKIK
jgi:hypothetical protein